MSLDRRGRQAADSLAGSLRDVTPSRADLAARQQVVQRRRMRTALAAFVVLVLVAVPVVLLVGGEEDGAPAGPGGGERPEGTLTSGAWSSVPYHTSGLDNGSVVSGMVSTADGVVAVGSVSTDGSDVRAAWVSEDGSTWRRSDAPGGPGRITAVGSDGDAVLAVGTAASSGGPAEVVWRSDDGGRTWGVAAEGDDLFGAAAPSGRPFVTDVLRVEGRWVAVGGAADGTGETWVSEDGREWTATFPEDRSGGPDVVRRADGSLLAYWGDQAWTSGDGVTWTQRQPSLPGDTSLLVVAEGAAVGVGYVADNPFTAPTPLLRSGDGGLTWVPDDSLLAAAPDATAWVVDVVGDVVVAGGSSEGSAWPSAWASTGSRSWVGLPAELSDGQLSGGMRLIATVGSRVVMMAGGPVAVAPGDDPLPAPTRFFVLDVDQLPAPPPPVSPVDPALLSEPGESAKDLAERIASEVLGASLVTTHVEDDGALRLVTLESPSRVASVATITEDASGTTFRFEDLRTDGLSIDGAGGVRVPASGSLTIVGYDGSLHSPEVMVDGVAVEGPGTVGPFDLVESSWLGIELRLPDGRVLRQLSPR